MSDSRQAVFLSYASQDADAARRICEALRAAGVEVWFDQSELRGGDAWDAKIRKQIKECALFVPVISANTQARREGYFRREWKLAVDRTHDMDDALPFLVPVVIDETPDAQAFVPDKFREVQWTRLAASASNGLPDGAASAAFGARVQHLLGRQPSTPAPANSPTPRTVARPPRARRHFTPWLVAAAVALCAGIGFVIFSLTRPDKDTVAPATAAQTEVQKLIAKIAAIVDKDADAARNEWALADSMGAEAVKLDPANPAAWAAYADAALGVYDFYFDRAAMPLVDARKRAQHALTLAPDSDEAKLAIARCYLKDSRTLGEAEQMLRGLLNRRRDDRRVLRALAEVLRRRGADPAADGSDDLRAEALAFYDRAAALPGGDPVALRDQAGLLAGLGRLAEADAALERSLALRRGPAAEVLKVWLLVLGHDDLDAAARAVERFPGSYYLREDACDVAARIWLWKREPAKCLRVLDGWHEDYLIFTPKNSLVGQCQQLLQKPEAARLAWKAALDAVEKHIAARAGETQDGAFFSTKALLLARLGDKLGAKEAARLAEQSRTNLSQRMLGNARVALALGELEQAAEALPARIASGMGRSQSLVSRAFRTAPADLRYDPEWDPLRGHPRFQALLAGLPRTLGEPATPPPTRNEKSVAVLPFTNMSEDPQNAFFADGVHEDILTNLALMRDLRVISRTSVMGYRDATKKIPQIGRELNVAYILQGSVRRAGSKVRVTGQLIRAATDEPIWADSFDRDLTDIFAIQSELSQAIATALSAALSPETQKWIARRPTEDLAAYDEFLKGRELRNNAPGASPSAMRDAEAHLKRAVRQDPNFALAWGELAIVHALHAFWGLDGSSTRLSAADAAIAHAVRLAPDDPGVIEALGTYAYYGYRDYARATAQYEKLARLRPNDAAVYSSLGLIQRRQGRWGESLRYLRKAVELDSANFGYLRNLKDSYLHGRRWDELRDTHARLIALAPDPLRQRLDAATDEGSATGSFAAADELLARLSPAQREAPVVIYYRKTWAWYRGDFAEFKRLDRLQPTFPDLKHPNVSAFEAGVVHWAEGDQGALAARIAEALTNIRAQTENEPANVNAVVVRACLEALAGRREAASQLARKAVEMMPESRDAFDGPSFRLVAAMVAAINGEKDRAIDELARALRSPSAFSVAALRAHPAFIPLRGDSRFEALLNDPKHNAPLF